MTDPHNPARPDESAFGAPRIKAGPDGKAVRLADLAQWLMVLHELSRQDAWGRILEAIAGPAPCLVYVLVNPDTGYAEPVPVREEWFDSADGSPGLYDRRALSAGFFSDGTRRPLPPLKPLPSVGRGHEGFVAWLKNQIKRGAALAVAESEARRLWGWGPEAAPVVDAEPDAPLDWAGMVNAFPKRRKGQPWSAEEKSILRDEFQKRGGWKRAKDGGAWSKDSAVQSALAAQLGMKRPALDKHLDNGPDHSRMAFGAMRGALARNG